ncbi:MAG TPA: DNA polymerase Y family protein [Chryseosolibacter sp.]|nr:DNA polymerase Y family protein [Chryseosolibacter sp.]
MARRFMSIWFRHLMTDWFSISQPHLRTLPFVLRTPSRGRMIITATNAVAEEMNITREMVVADAKAIISNLHIADDKPDIPEKLLRRIAEWCIRFTPVVAVDLPDGLIFDATGCAHLWGGEDAYLNDVVKKLQARGYDVKATMADSQLVAWGASRFLKDTSVVPAGAALETLLKLPPEALRIETGISQRLHQLGLHQVKQFISIPRPALRKRFGPSLLQQLDKALGLTLEMIDPVIPVEQYEERLPCLDPIITAPGIEIALGRLLDTLCNRLRQDQKGIRIARLVCHRLDSKIVYAEISTNKPSHNVKHLFKLFGFRLSAIDPGPGIELFILQGLKTEDVLPQQERMWDGAKGLSEDTFSELIDRISLKTGANSISRYLPSEHHWPERSFKKASSLDEPLITEWRVDKPRPLHLLSVPEPIHVTAPIPDYPPMLFRYNGKVHKVVKADGPERVEQEWWIQEGQHRDYYTVEDEEGGRYWLFRAGHYHDKHFHWFLHGFFS